MVQVMDGKCLDFVRKLKGGIQFVLELTDEIKSAYGQNIGTLSREGLAERQAT